MDAETEAEELARRAISEAIDTLGYLARDAAPRILAVMPQCGYQSPTAIATALRKSGEQIGREEKRALGIRANGFMSREALSELTEKGKRIPLKAHEQTLLRAHFTRLRYSEIVKYYRNGADELRCRGVFGALCPGCTRLHGETIPTLEASPFAPPDCNRDGCALGYWPEFNFGARTRWRQAFDSVSHLRITARDITPQEHGSNLLNFVLTCAVCGHVATTVPSTDDSEVICSACGETHGTLGEVKELAALVGVREVKLREWLAISCQD